MGQREGRVITEKGEKGEKGDNGSAGHVPALWARVT